MNILAIYEGSDGAATTALYKRLHDLGATGQIALNLFRAHKCSGRAKEYRGRGFKGAAYDRKQWSMANLCGLLATSELGWGWKHDPSREFHCWVLYVDLPTGQVSFHTSARGIGPDYPGEWDGIREAGASRIIRWVEHLLGLQTSVTSPPPSVASVPAVTATHTTFL